MNESIETVTRLPRAYCMFCAVNTPHRHERMAVAGKQVARAVCLACNQERPKHDLDGASQNLS